jgi:hypothetical protein
MVFVVAGVVIELERVGAWSWAWRAPSGRWWVVQVMEV